MGRFFFHSGEGDGLSVPLRLKHDGHSVTFYSKDPKCRDSGKGLVPLSTSSRPDQRSTVIFDSVGESRLGRQLRAAGHACIGGNELEKWEEVRAEGAKAMEEHGIELPETYMFKTLDEALAFLKKSDGEFYFKPDGHAISKMFTRKGDVENLRRFLEWGRPQLRKLESCQLQRPVEGDMVEVDVEVWLNETGPVSYAMYIEQKKFLTGNYGPTTGCASSLTWDINERDPVVGLTIGPFLDTLVESGYVGCTSISGMFTPDLTFYGLEFTQRLGWDATEGTMVLFDESLGDQWAEFARSRIFNFERSREGAMTLRLSTIPCPMDDSKDEAKLSGLPLDEEVMEHPDFHPNDVMLDKAGLPVTAVGSGYLGVLTTVGSDLKKMRKHLVDTAKELFPQDEFMYRKDPIASAEKTVEFLRKHKLCRDPFDG